MRLLRNAPIKRKLTVIVMVTTLVALLVSCIALVGYEQAVSRRHMVAQMSEMAKIVGDNSSAALAFGDPASAELTLRSLKVDPEILGAAIYDLEGGVFATYRRDEGVDFVPPRVKAAGHRFREEDMELFSVIQLAGEPAGTVYIRSDLEEMRARLWRYIAIAGLVMFATTVIAYFLSARLMTTISSPISHLAEVAGRVASEENYSIRALKQDEDELGRLVDGFNQMLTQIQLRDSALQAARNQLEDRVTERTRELAHSLSLLNSTLNSTTEGILAIQSCGTVICSNDRFKDMWGTPPGMMEQGDGRTVIAHLASQAKDSGDFQRALDALRASPDVPSSGEVELRDGRVFELYSRPHQLENVTGGVVIAFRDVTERKQAEIDLKIAHERLLETSRMAGKAEVASSVLHNVGNILNSVNVSATLVSDNIAKSKIAGLSKAVALMHAHEHDLANFLSEDPRGKHLTSYLAQLSEHLQSDQQASMNELDSLRQNISHIKEIVAMQQSYAGVSAVEEIIDAADLVEDSLRMDQNSLQLHGIEVVREFEKTPPVRCDKHKVLQILVNLVRNAQQSCVESGRPDKRLTLRVSRHEGFIRIAVADNGSGISGNDLTRVFSYGFTTKKDGHGFGLHGAALSAKEMRGSLHVHSEGAGSGATFTLHLPLANTEDPA